MVMMLVVGSVTADGTGAKLGQNLIFCLVRYRPYVLSVVLILLVLICYLILQTIWLTVKTGLQLVSHMFRCCLNSSASGGFGLIFAQWEEVDMRVQSSVTVYLLNMHLCIRTILNLAWFVCKEVPNIFLKNAFKCKCTNFYEQIFTNTQ